MSWRYNELLVGKWKWFSNDWETLTTGLTEWKIVFETRTKTSIFLLEKVRYFINLYQIYLGIITIISIIIVILPILIIMCLLNIAMNKIETRNLKFNFDLCFNDLCYSYYNKF